MTAQASAPCAVTLPEIAPSVVWAGVHWLTLVVTGLAPQELIDVASNALGGLLFEELPVGIWTYQRRAVERVTGAFVAWTPATPDAPARSDMVLNLTGAACELLGMEDLQDLCLVLGTHARPTRLDLAWDTDLFKPALAREAMKAGNAVTHAKADKCKWIEEGPYSTYYIGKRGSDKNARLVRFYDLRGPTRVEIELHGERAYQVWAKLLFAEGGLNAWSSVALSYLVGFLDFRDRSVDENVGRCPRLEWWESFTQGASALYLPIPRKAPDLKKTQIWLEDSVAPSLALIADTFASPVHARLWLERLYRDGQERRTPARAALLDITKQLNAAMKSGQHR